MDKLLDTIDVYAIYFAIAVAVFTAVVLFIYIGIPFIKLIRSYYQEKKKNLGNFEAYIFDIEIASEEEHIAYDVKTAEDREKFTCFRVLASDRKGGEGRVYKSEILCYESDDPLLLGQMNDRIVKIAKMANEKGYSFNMEAGSDIYKPLSLTFSIKSIVSSALVLVFMVRSVVRGGTDDLSLGNALIIGLFIAIFLYGFISYIRAAYLYSHLEKFLEKKKIELGMTEYIKYLEFQISEIETRLRRYKKKDVGSFGIKNEQRYAAALIKLKDTRKKIG